MEKIDGNRNRISILYNYNASTKEIFKHERNFN